MTEPKTDEQLLEIARAATPGPWYHCQPFMTLPSRRTVHGPIPAERVDYVSTWPDKGTPPGHKTVIPMALDGQGVRSVDMAFAATFNPTQAIALIERAQAAEGEAASRVHFETYAAMEARAWAAEEALKAAEDKREEERKYEGVARFVDSETIAELMDAGARTWAPISEAKPERNGSLIIMTGDAVPIVGQAFWHEVDGVWRLYWSAIAPGVDCWNDPIDETNHGVLAFMPMPEAPCDVRVDAIRRALSDNAKKEA